VALCAASQERLDRLGDEIARLGKGSHNTAQDFPQVVEALIDVVPAEKPFYPDDVRTWARGRGWREEDAHELGVMAETVYYTLEKLGRP